MTFDYTKNDNLEGLVIKVGSTLYKILKDDHPDYEYKLQDIEGGSFHYQYNYKLIKSYIKSGGWKIVEKPNMSNYSLEELIANFRKLL